MAHQPYPSRDRALHQIDRHIDEVGPMIGGRPHAVTPFGQSLIDGTNAASQAIGDALAGAFAKMVPAPQRGDEYPVDEYRLSTRPSVISGQP